MYMGGDWAQFFKLKIEWNQFLFKITKSSHPTWNWGCVDDTFMDSFSTWALYHNLYFWSVIKRLWKKQIFGEFFIF